MPALTMLHALFARRIEAGGPRRWHWGHATPVQTPSGRPEHPWRCRGHSRMSNALTARRPPDCPCRQAVPSSLVAIEIGPEGHQVARPANATALHVVLNLDQQPVPLHVVARRGRGCITEVIGRQRRGSTGTPDPAAPSAGRHYAPEISLRRVLPCRHRRQRAGKVAVL